MAKVIKFFSLVIWIGIVDCAPPVSREKTQPEINKNTVTISISHREYSNFEPYKIRNSFHINSLQELDKALSDQLRQMEEYLNSIRIRTPNINLPFDYFSTFPFFTISSNPNNNFPSIPYNPQRNPFLDIVSTKKPFHINEYNNFLPIPSKTQQNQILEIQTNSRPFNVNSNNNFQTTSDNAQKNQIYEIQTTNRPFYINTNNNFQSNPDNTQNNVPLTSTNRPFITSRHNFQSYSPQQNQITFSTKRPVITTKKEVIDTIIPVQNTTPYIEDTSTVLSEETTTEQNFEDYDDSTRPITLLNRKSDQFNKTLLRSGPRVLPEVEHGSVQAGL